VSASTHTHTHTHIHTEREREREREGGRRRERGIMSGCYFDPLYPYLCSCPTFYYGISLVTDNLALPLTSGFASFNIPAGERQGFLS
jgi:hypothetical protein